jgi:hypothetical protein
MQQRVLVCVIKGEICVEVNVNVTPYHQDYFDTPCHSLILAIEELSSKGIKNMLLLTSDFIQCTRERVEIREKWKEGEDGGERWREGEREREGERRERARLYVNLRQNLQNIKNRTRMSSCLR